MVNRYIVTAAAVVAFSSGLLEQASAQPRGRRARLSADLAEHVSTGSSGVDVIVHGTRAEVEALAARYNVRVKRQLRSGGVLQVTGGQLEAIQADGSQEHISSDTLVRSSADVTAVTIGADRVWQGAGALAPLSGEGVGVAVIDSGVDTRHAALRNRVVASVDFTGGDGVDRYGHGTHVAATIAGRAGRTADTAEYQGIAAGAHIVSLRVLGDDGSGVASSVIEAIDWAIEHKRRYNIRVINLSLGGPVVQSYRDDPLCEAVDRAIDAGIVVVASAGNHGQTADGRRIFGAITSPGNHPGVITVGALDTKQTADRADDGIATWSSRGPTMYDLVMKPDLVAPGTRVTSAEAAGSYLSTAFPQRHVAGSGATGYMQLSGTSMAASVVSGAAALLLESRPRLSPRETKLALQITSSFMAPEGLAASGSGSMNLAVASLVVDALRSGRANSRSQTKGDTLGAGLAQGEVRFLVISHANGDSIVWGNGADSIVWGNFLDSIVWGNAADSIIWGNSADSIVWGNANDSIVWGNAADSIVWGNASDSIVWGNFVDSIVWGNSADSIVWGNAANDSIVWGNNLDSIVWGNTADSIVWGNTADSIVWGNASDSIVWGNSQDSIVWGNSATFNLE